MSDDWEAEAHIDRARESFGYADRAIKAGFRRLAESHYREALQHLMRASAAISNTGGSDAGK